MTAHSHQAEASRPDRWVAMFVLLIASFMNMIDVTIVNVATPRLQNSFHATSSQIEWVVAAYILVFALGLLPFGRLGDIYGRRRIFLIGVAVFTLGSLLCGLAPSMGGLIAARVVQGFGGAMMIPQTLAIAQVVFPPHERAAAFSLFGLVAGLAAVTGPVAGGLLIDADFYGLDWRPIFLINIPIGALAILGALRFIPRIPGAPQLRLDWGGVALASLTILLLIFPLIEGREAGWPAWVFAMLVAAIPAAVLFVLWERRQEARGLPELLPVRLMTNRNFLIGTAMATMLFSGVPGFFLVLAIYLQSGNGLEPLQSGLTTVPFSVGVLVASAVSGRLGMRWPRRRITVGALMLATTMIWLRFVVEGVVPPLDRWQFLPPLFLGGLGLGIAIGPMFQTVLANVPPRDAGSGSGALQSLQQIGGALGVALMGQIFFSRLAEGLQAGGDKLPVFAHALTGALLYNTAAFLVIAGIVRLLPRPVAAARHPTPASAAEV
jgi:EmrB/QacA subfamily drug resistance transporter